MEERINKIKKYFKSFEIVDGIAYTLVSFPKKWQVPSNEILMETFNVKTVLSEKGNGFYFCCEISNGIYPLFDAVDFTIDFNLNIEEKSELLIEKVNELKTIFAEKPIEVLRTIQFKYSEKKPKNIRKNNKKKNNDSEDILKSEITDNTDYSATTVTADKNNENNSLLDFAQDLVNNEQ